MKSYREQAFETAQQTRSRFPDAEGCTVTIDREYVFEFATDGTPILLSTGRPSEGRERFCCD